MMPCSLLLDGPQRQTQIPSRIEGHRHGACCQAFLPGRPGSSDQQAPSGTNPLAECTVQHNVVYRASTHLDLISRQADQISDRPHLLAPPVWRGGLAISRDLRLNPMDTVCPYVTPFSRIRDSDSDSDAAPRGRLLSKALPRNYTALPSFTDHGRLPPPARGFNWAPAPSSPAASLRISTEAARHRLALTHHVLLRAENAPMPCAQTPAASWQEVDGFERGGPLLPTIRPVQRLQALVAERHCITRRLSPSPCK